MKRVEIFFKIAIILSFIVFLATIGDFLSLHDIQKDYVSKSALENLEVETSRQLPDWTNTKLEWLSVTVSFVIRFFAIIFILVVLFTIKKKLKPE